MKEVTENTLGTVYLLHFDPPYKHSGHYYGWTTDLNATVKRHYAGTSGAKMVTAAVRAGSKIIVARRWKDVPYAFVKKMRAGKNAIRRCPRCRAEGRYAQQDDRLEELLERSLDEARK